MKIISRSNTGLTSRVRLAWTIAPLLTYRWDGRSSSTLQGRQAPEGLSPKHNTSRVIVIAAAVIIMIVVMTVVVVVAVVVVVITGAVVTVAVHKMLLWEADW